MDSDDVAGGAGAPCNPVVLDDWATAASAIELLICQGQAMAFVSTNTHLSAVVTFHDLEFACEWAGPSATVADAAACALVDVATGSSPSEAARAFSEASARWLQMSRVRSQPSRPGAPVPEVAR